MIMALIFACSRCGFVLRRVEAEEPAFTARTPILVEISRRYGSRCPRCMKPLNLKPELIEIVPAGSPMPKPPRKAAASPPLRGLQRIYR
ncbi:MAG: hypothetical protein DRN06_05310 [Thermoprotei archaeon]|nr:MAG: hypothetical protein DRN06_05310 [Thermoprotei archaeon]